MAKKDRHDEIAIPNDRIRVREQQRDAAIFGLNLALQDGQLNYEETQKRANMINHATYMDEVMSLIGDLNFGRNLPAPTNPQVLDVLVEAKQQGVMSLEELAGSPATAAAVTPYSDSTKNSLSMVLFSSSVKKGPWVVGPSHRIVGAFGATMLDFRQAQLTQPVTVVKAHLCFSGTEIRVPETYRITHSTLPIFGGTIIKEDKDVTLSLDDLPADAPVIDVRGLLFFGGMTIRRVAVKKK